MPQTPTVQQTLSDPKFYSLPSGEQQKVLATLDPNYAQLPLGERTKVLQMGQQQLGQSGSPTSPLTSPPNDASLASLPPNASSIPTPPPPSGFLHSLAAPFVGAAQGIKSAVYEGPQNPTEAALEQQFQLSPGTGRAVLALKRMLVDPQVEQGRQAVSEFQQADSATPWTSFSPTPAAQTHRQLAAGHAIAALVPALGPWAASVGQREGEQLGTGDYSGAAGTAVGNALLALAPKAAGAAADLVPGTIRRVAGASPAVAAQLARDAAESNRVTDLANQTKQAEAVQKWQADQAKADYDHSANLLKLRQQYDQTVRDQTAAAQTGTAADRAQVAAKNLAAKQAYDQSVRDQVAKYTADRDEATRANADAQRAYNQSIGRAAQQNRAATAAAAAARDQSARTLVGGSQLIYGLNQLDRALRDRAATMYDAIRAKVGDSTLPGTGLAQATNSALSNIKGTSVVPTVFRDILGKYPEAEPESIEYQGAQIPRGHPLYDVLAQNGATTAPPVAFADLQGYYSELGKELSRGTLPSDVYLATRDLQESIGGMMQQLADQSGPGVGRQLNAARIFYRKYMDTFHEPAGPSASGSPVAQALLAKDPEVAVSKFAGDSGDRGIAILRRYSDSLANLAQDARQNAQRRITVPARKAVADLPGPKTTAVPAGANLPLPPVLDQPPPARAAALPLPPVLPDAPVVPYRAPKLTPRRLVSSDDIVRANDAAVRARAAGLAGHLFWWTGVWPAFRILSQLSRGAEVSGKGLLAMPAGAAAGMATEELLSHPAVVDFLTKATRQQIATIPPDLRGAMPEIVDAARSRGVPVSPVLAAYSATVRRNQGQQAAAQSAGQAPWPPPSDTPAQLTTSNGATQ